MTVAPKILLIIAKAVSWWTPKDTKSIAKAIKDILVHPDTWNKFSKNGIMNTRKHYTWKSHVQTYVEKVKTLHQKYEALEMDTNEQRLNIGKRFSHLHYFIITDIDNTLLGDNEQSLGQLMKLLEENKNRIGFGVATGRVLGSALKVLQEHNIMMPDIIISGVGSEITYGESLYHDKGWEKAYFKKLDPGPDHFNP